MPQNINRKTKGKGKVGDAMLRQLANRLVTAPTAEVLQVEENDDSRSEKEDSSGAEEDGKAVAAERR